LIKRPAKAPPQAAASRLGVHRNVCVFQRS
jgi:hypothetical protein